MTQLRDLAALCLGNGAHQFWIVEPSKKTVTVLLRDGTRRVYETAAAIPLEDLSSADLPVAEIFG